MVVGRTIASRSMDVRGWLPHSLYVLGVTSVTSIASVRTRLGWEISLDKRASLARCHSCCGVLQIMNFKATLTGRDAALVDEGLSMLSLQVLVMVAR